jgi:phenylpyruvate tautomerase PptA (4-oxalocrotonate tautomerase family)
MNLTRRVLLGMTGLGLAASIAVPAFAATPTAGTTFNDPQQTLIQALIKRFSLNETDLKTFFQEQRAQHESQGAERVVERLTAQVAAGKLTEAQKSAIIAKIAEAKAKHEEARKLTPEECRKLMEAYRTELEAWVTAQGLDRSYVPLIMGNQGGRGGHGGSGMGGQMGPRGRQGGRGGMMGSMNGRGMAAPGSQAGAGL